MRLAAIGLEADYTAAAARQAALNAGAKIELVLAGQLDGDAARRLAAVRPEIVLFAGGTDGGQRDQVLENAEAVAAQPVEAHVVIACNRDIAADVAGIFGSWPGTVQIVGNVMPDIGVLAIEPARHAIHDVFIRHVIRGKGLSHERAFGDAVIMPTPEAVLEATRLLLEGDGQSPGLGDVIVVDIGGATTDVHSGVAPRPVPAGVRTAGLPTLPLTRTVQGDLGVRWSATSVLEADKAWLAERAAAGGRSMHDLQVACRHRHADPAYLPSDEADRAFDRDLAVACIAHALRRHCGTLSTIYRPGQGTEFVRRGLDLRDAPVVIGTGGMLVHDQKGLETLDIALKRRDAKSLTPLRPKVLLDRNYIMAAAGLLATRDRRAALDLLTSELSDPAA